MNYIELFKDYLLGKGYQREYLKVCRKYSHGKKFDVVEILDKDKKYVIQAFALMCDINRKRHHRYPFYLGYHQKTPNGIDIYPPYSIAVYGDSGEWHFYDASNTGVSRYNLDEYLINYEKAQNRFMEKLSLADMCFDKPRTLKFSCYLIVCFMLAYLILYVLASNGVIRGLNLPFNPSAIVPYFATMAFFVVLPAILPFINSLTLANNLLKLDFYKDI